ncbi:MAG TPA: hypothetical protein VJ846_08735 [Sphingomicrobium sp.]|nr:hypothetical protein [Sphingomicrobium sp.]
MPVRDPHAVRIVPTKAFQGEVLDQARLAGRQLTYRNGPLLTAVEVFTLFWGSAWRGSEASLVGQINQFFQYVVTSPLIDQLAEYSSSKLSIGHGSFAGTQTVVDSEPGPSITDTDIQTFLTSHSAASEAFKQTRRPASPATNRLVFIYLPPGTAVSMGGSASCTGFCGYHSDIGGEKFYAVMPFPSCSGCTGGLTTFEALTSTSSHELCEAITDPVAGSGWYNDQYGEIGDLCAWQTKKLGAYTVQKEWSNSARTCV